MVLFSFLFAVCLIPLSGVCAAEKKEIRVGAINSMTGMNVMTGSDQKWAYEQAIADINKKGGVFVKELGKKLPIKLIFADDKSTAAGGAAGMERLIKMDKIDLAISSNITPINIAAGTVCEKYKVYYGIACAWLDQIEEQNFRYVSDFFFSGPGAAQVPFILWNAMPEAERIKRPVLITEDNPDGEGFRKGFQHFAKEYGYTFVVDEPYAPGIKDFSAYILKYKAKKADALLWLGSPTDSITLVRQMKEQRCNIPYVHGWKGFWPVEFLKAMGKDCEYIIHDGFWADSLPYPGAKDLGERYIKDHGKDSVVVGLYYANPQILAMAIERAGSIKSEKVRDQVFGGEFKGTVMGTIKFNEKGLCETPSYALQWWKGERKPIYPPIEGGWKIKMAPPWDQR